jgi:hypothetical protein
MVLRIYTRNTALWWILRTTSMKVTWIDLLTMRTLALLLIKLSKKLSFNKKSRLRHLGKWLKCARSMMKLPKSNQKLTLLTTLRYSLKMSTSQEVKLMLKKAVYSNFKFKRRSVRSLLVSRTWWKELGACPNQSKIYLRLRWIRILIGTKAFDGQSYTMKFLTPSRNSQICTRNCKKTYPREKSLVM